MESQIDINQRGSQQVLAALGEAPVAVLKNGIKIANFSSAHTFKFVTGEVLPACSVERAKLLHLDCQMDEDDNKGGWTDVELDFSLSHAVMVELERLARDYLIDIILVSPSICECVRKLARRSSDNWEPVYSKTRCVCYSDRIEKTIHSNRFCR